MMVRSTCYTIGCLMALMLSGCGGADTEAPKFDGFVLAVAEHTDQVSTAWMPATDNVTAADDIAYALHYDVDANFEPNSASLYQTYTGETSATVTGLTAGTEYYFRIVATDLATNSTEAINSVSVVTATNPSVRTNIIVKNSDELVLGAAQVSGIDNSTYTFESSASSVAPDVGSILIGKDNDGNAYIRKIDGVTQDNTEIVVETSDASLHDIFESMSLSTEVVLRNPPQEAASTSNALPRVMSRGTTANAKPQLKWKDNLLTITESVPAVEVTQGEDATNTANRTTQAKLFDASNVKIDLKASEELSVTGSINFVPSLKTDVKTNGFMVTSAKTQLSGKLTLELTLAYDYKGAITIKEDKVVFNTIYKSRYFLNGVPVYQETTFKLTAKFEGKATSAIKGEAKATVTSNVTINVDYDGSDWDASSTESFDKSLTVKAEAIGSATAEVRFVPEVTVRFYKSIASTVSVEPYVKAEVEAKAIAEAELVENEFTAAYGFTKFDAFAGVDINVMADATVFGINIARYPEKGTKNLFNQQEQLFGLPTLEGTAKKISANQYTFTGKATPFTNAFGLENPFDESSAHWVVFPSIESVDGMTVDWSGDKPTSLYFIGNSEMLGEIGRQYIKVPIVSTKFTKISSTGEELSVDATEWDCVKENETGLIWEKKTNDGGLRDSAWTYLNTSLGFDIIGRIKSGQSGTQNPVYLDGMCSISTSNTDNTFCHTEDYIDAVNAEGLCGYSDWRLPTENELPTLLHCSEGFTPKWDSFVCFSNYITDTTYFPDNYPNSGIKFSSWSGTIGDYLWSGEWVPAASSISATQAQYFINAYSVNPRRVSLVR